MRSLVLLFGEDDNDTRALAIICRALAPEGSEVTTRVIKQPPVLNANAAPRKKQAMTATIANFARESSKGFDRVIVVAHRDCDACEPAHVQDSASLESELRTAGVAYAVAATPAWEIESWRMAFPAAVRLARRCWRELNYGSSNTGAIPNAKERLIRDLRPANVAERARCRDYVESDSITIAERLVTIEPNLANKQLFPSSFDLFKTKLQAALV